MIGLDQDMKTLRQFRRTIVVEEESHAALASDSSNAIASGISSGWTSYHFATRSREAFSFTLRTRTCEGTPDRATVGRLKEAVVSL